ncbi:MAG: T9SS type A sorting domain-containing protein [Bacteroidales bacterium]|nr:T9SS type A sorting domain-containing protein [Bacteroidales bacterium]
MKKTFLLILIFVVTTTLAAQDLMTIGEVFDFEIGDEFQTKGDGLNQPPNADRITITDKYFSSESDSVFYVQFHNSYYSDYDGINYFYTKTDTVMYTNLDSSITTFDSWISNDTNMSYYDTVNVISDQYCNTLINGFHCSIGFFEPVSITRLFGKGLGLVKYYEYNPVDWSDMDIFLFYYKKNGISCGIPDTLFVSVPEDIVKPEIKIIPNPANVSFRVVPGTFTYKEMKIFGSNGSLIRSQIVHNENLTFDCSFLDAGIYFVLFTSESTSYGTKLVIR